MKLVFFRIPKPKQFSYPPRYYDEEKERQELRKRELGLAGDGTKIDFRTQVGATWRRLRKIDSKRQKKAQMSVVVYLLIVAMLIYLIFFS
jgi:hypothetical protein